MTNLSLSDEEWQRKLTAEQYAILRQKGTEAPFTGALLDNKEPGLYACVGCGSVLFKSDDKYESRQLGLMGWPSFADIARSDAVELVDDNSHGMQRIEVVCKTCGGHLGHLFDDTSAPTGKHYCINSACLNFEHKTDDK